MRHFLLWMMVLFLSCDGGLTVPADIEPGIGGTVFFAQGTWPPADSLQGLWLFASIEYPLDSSRIIAGVLVEPRTIFLFPSLQESLPFFIDSVRFDFHLQPGTYKYIGVIQQLRPELEVRNFRIVGVLPSPADSSLPRLVTIRYDEFVNGLRLDVNFAQPPPQPF